MGCRVHVLEQTISVVSLWLNYPTFCRLWDSIAVRHFYNDADTTWLHCFDWAKLNIVSVSTYTSPIWEHASPTSGSRRHPNWTPPSPKCGLTLNWITFSRHNYGLMHWSARHLDRVKRIWNLSPMRAAKVQASLRIRAVSPEPSLLAHTSSESRGTFRQKARSLASLNGWACAVKICHDGMLEDTNSLDGAYLSVITNSFIDDSSSFS